MAIRTGRPSISIIMPCFNAGKFLGEAIDSVISQSFKDWELIIVNDGSTDNSESIAGNYSVRDNRITVKSKENGGYVSARLFGYKFISESSRFLLFFDADDVLHKDMLSTLFELINLDSRYGAVFCNHILIDPEGNKIGNPYYGTRIQPTLFGIRQVSEDCIPTSFITIFCWAHRMIEPMTLLRREAYEQSSGWDIRFGKGQGNIGDGVLLFSEIALTWKVGYLKDQLYFYRKHKDQATADSKLNKGAGEKVLSIWKERMGPAFKYTRDIKAAIIMYNYRLAAWTDLGSLKYFLRYKPFKAIKLFFGIVINYILSLQLIFYSNTKVFEKMT